MSNVRKKGDVIVQEKAQSDLRIVHLGKLIGNGRYDAFGRVVTLWGVCASQRAAHLSVDIVDLIVSHKLLCQAGLAELVDDDTVRIRGARFAEPATGRGPEPDEQAYRLADLLAHLISQRQPSNRSIAAGKWEATRKRWAKSFDLAQRRDGRSWEDLERVLRFSQRDSFWSRNILSAEKFRAQYDKLDLQSKRAGSGRAQQNLLAGDLFELADKLEEEGK